MTDIMTLLLQDAADKQADLKAGLDEQDLKRQQAQDSLAEMKKMLMEAEDALAEANERHLHTTQVKWDLVNVYCSLREAAAARKSARSFCMSDCSGHLGTGCCQ